MKNELRINRSDNSVLIVGNFLSHKTNICGVCEELAKHLQVERWNVITTSSVSNRYLRVFDMLQTVWAKRNEYQVAQVDVYSGKSFIWAELVANSLKFLQKPIILSLHGGNLPQFSKRWPGRVERLLNIAEIVTCPSRYLIEEMKQYRDGLRYIPNPIDISNYTYKHRPNPKPKLIWLRAFHHIYNPELAIKVLHRLRKISIDANLIMVGPDKGDGSFQDTQALARKLGVLECIKWPRGVPKSEVAQWLNKGDIFLNTTNIDNTPVSVIEAMACGLPIVNTNVGGIPYLLGHDIDVLLVPQDDSKAMADAVRRIITDPGLAKRLSHNARQKAERFDWSVILPQWENLFVELVADG